MKHGKLLITPLRAGVQAASDTVVDVLVRIQAPSASKDARCIRAPLHLSLVLDRSGSMRGRPIEEARRCAAFVLNQLRSVDKASLVAYDSTVETLVPLIALSNKRLLRNAIESIRPKGTTALHGGWLAGAESLTREASPAVLSRVVLLSDGRANEGVMDPRVIWQQCAHLAEAGVTTSTYGVGKNFNEKLMTGMARAGRGHAYYGETAEDLFDPFVEELSLLNELFARNVELQFTCPGITVQILNDYPMLGNNRFQLPDIGYDSEGWCIVRLSIPASATLAKEQIDALAVSAQYLGSDGERRVLQSNLTLTVISSMEYADQVEDPAVASRLSELSAADLQDRARLAAKDGNWEMVDQLLRKADRIAGDHPWLIAILEEMRSLARRREKENFAKEATYSAQKLRSRLCAPDEAKGGSDGPVPEYVRRKAAQGKAELPD